MDEVHKFEVGQELAIPGQWSGPPTIHKIVKVTPSGRAVLERGTQIEPNLRIRGADRWGPYSALIVTDKIRDQVERCNLANQMRETDWGKASLLTLRTVAFVLEHSK